MNGFILLDKPQGKTSFAVVASVRKICNEKRVGHTGTLDPMATGVLPILTGKATKLCRFIINANKRYTARIKLGVTTNSLDITGDVLSVCNVNVSEKTICDTLSSFKGKIMQVPPMFSAIKKDGKRLYELAHSGITVDRNPRTVFINELNYLGMVSEDEFDIDVICSKGTYIRTLADDIGKVLGCGAVLSSLRRTMTADFEINDCVTLEQLIKDRCSCIRPPQDAIWNIPCVSVTYAQRRRFLCGGDLSLDRVVLPSGKSDFFKIFFEDEFLGIGKLCLTRNSLLVECAIADRT